MIDIQTSSIVVPNFLPNDLFVKYSHLYPVDWIKEYCSNPEVSEHESSLHGNYSAPTNLYNTDLEDFVLKQVPGIISYNIHNDKKYDHFYVNFHYDEHGSFLEPHNDLKDFRWLITCQVYMNQNQGARLLSRDLSVMQPIPCFPNTFYSINATPWSWHDVPGITKPKKSILFRIGKRRHNSIAHLDESVDTGYVIYNNYHADKHYAKLGHRMGNLTEAWLHSKGAKNIYHSSWRNEENLNKVINKAVKRHTQVRVILSGYLASTLDQGDNSALQTVTAANKSYTFDPNADLENYFRLTDENINSYAKTVFSFLDGNDTLSAAERIMYNYYKDNLHLNYVDLF